MSEVRGGIQELPKPKRLAVSWRRLIRANKESIRLGFSRNLTNLRRLPKEWVYMVAEAYRHTSCDVLPLTNVRLVILLPRDLSTTTAAAKSLGPVMLDVTHDTWREIIAENPAERLQ